MAAPRLGNDEEPDAAIVEQAFLAVGPFHPGRRERLPYNSHLFRRRLPANRKHSE
jgi:hypothetical protein